MRRMIVTVIVRVVMVMRMAMGVPRGVHVQSRIHVSGPHAGAPATQLAQRPRNVRSWRCTSKPGGARSFIGPGQAWIGYTRSHSTQ